MGCCVSSHRINSETNESPPADLPSAAAAGAHHPLPVNCPPPNLKLLSSVRTLRSHLAMSPPASPLPFFPRRPPADIHYQPIRYPPKRVSPTPNPRFRRNQVAAVDHVFDDLSTAVNFSKEVRFGWLSPEPGSGGGSPMPVPLADIWNNRREDCPPPPPSDSWSSAGTAAGVGGRTLTKRELMSRRERERERGVRWDPLSGEFGDTSANGGMLNFPRRVTFEEMQRKMGFGNGPGPRAARRIARSRVGGRSSTEASKSFEGGSPSLGRGFGGGGGAAVRGRNDVGLARQRMVNEYDRANELLSMEAFVFF